jgi:alcohol dehydrogenase (cytochrome c)
MLVDYRHDGKTVNGLVDVARDGYLWELARDPDGTIQFVAGEPIVKQNVFKSLDPKTGRPNVDPVRQPGTGKKADFCPSLWGGKDWPPAAYSPKTRLLYIPANENLCGTSVGAKVAYNPGQPYTGATTTLYIAPGADHIGELQAWDLDAGKKAWSHPFANSQLWGPVLATGGGVVFMGGTNDRYFRAFDASTGKVLWQIRTGSGVIGVPVSFAIDGKQYIAVQSGWGVDSARMQARLNLARPYQFPDVPQGGAIWVFALP